jgi:hypothetical protein
MARNSYSGGQNRTPIELGPILDFLPSLVCVVAST